MGRPSRKAKTIRRADEFDLARLRFALQPPLTTPNAYAWDIAAIREARDHQMTGVFYEPVRLAQSTRTEPALFTAYRNRLAPLRSVGVSLVPPNDSAPATRIAAEADALYGRNGIGASTKTLASIHGELVDHGVAIGNVEARVRDGGARTDLILRHWPLQWVRWDSLLRCYTTQIDWADREAVELEDLHAQSLDLGPYGYGAGYGRARIPIVHGDGRWIVFSKHEFQPFQQEACLLASALLWAALAFPRRDWSQNSKAHGAAKMFGELPEGIALTDSEGNPTPEASAFVNLLMSIMAGDSLAGIRPAGSKTEFVANGSTNWQIFSELITNGERSAARIYLGTDGTLGAQGGAPGVDISALFGIATTLMQGDAECIEDGLFTGLLQPWAALNFGDSQLAPHRRYMLPDADASRFTEDFGARNKAFHEAVGAERSNGFEITQERVNLLAKKYRVPAPTLKPKPEPLPSVQAPAPTNGAVKVNGATQPGGTA